ncbi:MAG: glycosyltransferase family 4 protein [Myxococcota bacterium]|nr:glycosyltransferase family 4 protein [Myxococcota bacterium]
MSDLASVASTAATPISLTKRPRVLIIAELANPDWVSVPLVGWSHWHALSKLVDGHLVTHARNRENILRTGAAPERLTTIDTASLERPLYRVADALTGRTGGGRTIFTALGTFPYYYFEHLLWRRLGPRIRAHEWDVVHRLTPLTPASPSLLAAKCAQHGVPFVIGPLNGGLPWPKGFDYALLQEREWLSYVRGAYKLLPGYRRTRRFASAIITGSLETRRQIDPSFQDKTVYIPENAIDPGRFTHEKVGPVTLPLKVAFVGRFTLFKGADMLIEAAAPLVRAGRVKLDLIGDGQQAAALRALAEREGLPASIFAGWVDHTTLQDRLAASDVFAFPSIREFGGGVVLESMALGLVPIVMDYGGPGELVSQSAGLRLPMGSRAQIVDALRAALDELASDPSRIRQMGACARARVFRNFTWDAKAAQVLEVYRWVLGERGKPDFGMPLPDLS